MNFEIVFGRCQQVAGKLLELWGSLLGNEMQRSHGYQLVVVGQMRVLGGRASELLRYCSPRQAALAVAHVRLPVRGTGRAP